MSRQSKLPSSVLTSSESDRDPAVPMTSSVYSSSDLAGDIDNFSLEPCNVCQKKASSKVNEASWYCQECKEVLCHECKGLHNLFASMENHALVDLHPRCSPCTEEKQTNKADWYCTECFDYLCQGCKAHHKKFKLLRTHTIISSMEKARIVTKVATSDPLPSSIVKQHVHKVTNPATNQLQKPTNTQTDKATGENQTIAGPYSRRKAKYVTAFDATIPADTKIPAIVSSAFLPDARLLLVDWANKKLKLFDSSFCFVTSKTFQHSPRCVSVFDSSEVAVVTYNPTITRLSVQGNIKVTGTIRLEFHSWAVDYISRDRLAITSAGVNPNFFCVYSTSGTELARISRDTANNILFSNPCNVKVDRERSRAYVSDIGSNTVLALDLNDNNKLVFTYKHAELKRADGVTVDKEGNIYVCGSESHNIHQISPRGEHIQILLSRKDGLMSLFQSRKDGHVQCVSLLVEIRSLSGVTAVEMGRLCRCFKWNQHKKYQELLRKQQRANHVPRNAVTIKFKQFLYFKAEYTNYQSLILSRIRHENVW